MHNEQQIVEIADYLEAGMRCFVNIKSGEIKTVLDFDKWPSADEELWDEVNKELDENWSNYFEIEGMDSHQSFNLMADFTELIKDYKLKNRLINALNRSKPFRYFKWEVDNSGEHRQHWFDYKKMRYIEWVKDQFKDREMRTL